VLHYFNLLAGRRHRSGAFTQAGCASRAVERSQRADSWQQEFVNGDVWGKKKKKKKPGSQENG
jgi:hypothetical protein